VHSLSVCSKNRNPVPVICVACFLLLTGLSCARAAPENPARLERHSAFHIPAGSLESALLQFSRESEIQVIVSAPVADVSVAAVEGRLTAREALTALLGETGLVYSVVGNTVTIHTQEGASGPVAASSPPRPEATARPRYR
jgi:hypothetical protein